METYQDIIVFSLKSHFLGSEPQQLVADLDRFKRTVHQRAVDSLSQYSPLGTSFYKQIQQFKADALLCDEDTYTFYQQVLDVKPQRLYQQSLHYLVQIMKTLRQVSDHPSDLSKPIELASDLLQRTYPPVTDKKKKGIETPYYMKALESATSLCQIRHLIQKDHEVQSKSGSEGTQGHEVDKGTSVWLNKLA